MKRAGILTFQNANNYGAVLQAFALQETLKKLGFKTNIIDYDSPAMGLKSVQHTSFRIFCQKYLHLTSPVERCCDIDTSQFDILIVGSDQVWNPTITQGDSTYFLDFAGDEMIKVSYAASIGLNSELIQEHRQIFKDNIPRFQEISLREKDHIPFIEQFSHTKSGIVTASVDPSLLLTADEYSRLLPLAASPEEEDYIFLFSYNRNPRLLDFANMLSLHTGYKILAVSRFTEQFFVSGARVYDDIFPTEWLNLVKNAKIVLTDSFHGLMLSIVFERPFYIHTPNTQNVVRIMNALEMLGLGERRLSFIHNIGEVDFNLDYSYANKILALERQKAFDYLSKLSNL